MGLPKELIFVSKDAAFSITGAAAMVAHKDADYKTWFDSVMHVGDKNAILHWNIALIS